MEGGFGLEHASDPDRILVILPTWVGDFIMATPALRAIRKRYARASITFLMVPNLADLVASGDWMDRTVTWPTPSGVVNFLGLGLRLRREGFDLAVLFPNSFRAALMARLAGARRRVGYDRDGRGALLTDRLETRKTNGRYEPKPICGYYGRLATAVDSAEPGDQLELFTDPTSEVTVARRLESLGIASDKPLVIISPGASFGSSKLWLPERFAAVGDRLIDSTDAAVVITCGPGEAGIARTLHGAMDARAYLFDEPLLTLGELKALIKRGDLLICNDIGPRHIAKAFGVSVVTVFGPTHMAWTDTDYPNERKVRIDVDCGPCQLKTCPHTHHKCMTGVTVDMVYERCAELLAERRLRRSTSC